MATISRYGTTAKPTTGRTKVAPDPSCQPCPDCGGLECLCRPRFFAGQLLSEQDLNRLETYIVEKNKLHNKHLWGSGVVCGLEVKCAPCDSGFVTVTSGYALSPCGEDIVVCKDDTVDICALIARCRTDSEPDCSPYRGQDSCGDVVEDWILSVRYAESPSRGVTPLTGSGQGCGCSCGTSSCSGGCGCGCSSCSTGSATGVAATQAPTQPKLNRGAPPSCEPTLTCETYRYDVFRAPVEDPKPTNDDRQTGISGVFAKLEGDMMARIACCLKQLEDALPAAPGDVTQPIPLNMQNAWFQWGCRMRTALANYFVRTGGHDCEAMAKLGAIVVPSPTQDVNAFHAAMQITVTLFALLVFEAMVACFCSNALPPCPPAKDPRVPLAVIKVRRRDCRVISVCNWHPLRKHVLTFPTLSYWFGFIPIARLLREGMHKVCCELFGLRNFFDRILPDEPQHDAAQPAPAAPPAPAAQPGPATQPAFAARMATTTSPASTQFSMQNAIAVDPIAGFGIDPGLFEALAARQAKDGGATTWADLASATLSREAVAIDPNLQGKEREAAVQRVAATGPLAILAGAFASVQTPVALGAGIAGGHGLGGSVLRMAMAGGGSGNDRTDEIDDLKQSLAAQAQEIAELKAAIAQKR